MKWPLGTLLLALLTSTAMAYPQPVQWQTYSIAETGTSVDLPTSIFTEKAERPAGYEIRLKTADGRAELTVLAGPNSDNEIPARFLAKRHSGNPPTPISKSDFKGRSRSRGSQGPRGRHREREDTPGSFG